MENNLNLEDFELDEIVEIELVGEKDTIDITVDDTHMFYANGIYTHNSAIRSEIVESDQMGGSIKKGQIGHFILSIAKTLEQKESGTANMAILKSRFGKDGIVFEDIIFDNGRIMIDVTNQRGKTFLETKELKEQKNQERINFVLDNLKKTREELENNN